MVVCVCVFIGGRGGEDIGEGERSGWWMALGGQLVDR